MSVEDFGLWSIIGNAISLSAFPAGVIYSWSIRAFARTEEVAKTSLVSGLLSIPLSIILFLFISLYGIDKFNLSIFILMFGILQLSSIILFDIVKGLVYATKPVWVGLSSLVFEFTKVGLAYILLTVNNINVAWLLLILAFAYILQTSTLLYVIRDKFVDRIDLEKIKIWAKYSWVPILSTGVSKLWTSDTLFVAIILGTSFHIGLYQSAKVFFLIIAYSEIFLRVLYPRLLRDRSGSDITSTLKFQLLFAMPMAIGSFILAPEFLTVLGGGNKFLPAVQALQILSIVAIIEGIEHLMNFSLSGAEIADKNKLSFKSLKTSWLVKISLLDYLKSIIYFSILFIVLIVFKDSNVLISAWAIAYAIPVLVFTILKSFLTYKFIGYKFPLGTLKYVLSGLIMGSLLFIIKSMINITGIFWTFCLIGLGATTYFSIVILIDVEVKFMVKRGISIARNLQVS